MNLHTLLLTENACYKVGRTITPKGIMVHSTGANNPWLKRYVGPDDGLLGNNQYGNHWNQDKPGGRQVCAHAFIGKLADGSVATYQTLPWDHRGWHAGGSANNTHIGFEICEDGLTDATYFNQVYTEAVELCVYLCKLYGLNETNILCHSEGNKLGIASNHADVMHWFPKYGKSMDTLRKAVKAAMRSTNENDTEAPNKTEVWYRVRKTWEDASSQKGAFYNIDNAKKCADSHEGCSVFDESGKVVYTNASTVPYLVNVNIPDLNIRKGPGINYAKVGKFTGIGVFTIIAESNGEGATKWGKLKSGAGWISLDFTNKI